MSAGTLTEAREGGSRTAARSYALNRVALALGFLIVVAILLRFWRLGHQGFWFDEANTAQDVHDTPGELLTLLKHYESTPPFYYCVAWVWARIFGFGEAGLRSLSAVCGVLVVPLSYWLGHKLVSRRTGLVAAALATFNPLLIWYSQEARAYELVVLLTGASLLALVYAQENPSFRLVGLWVIAAALALATEYYAFAVVIPEALWLLYRHRQRREVQLGIGAVAVWSVPLLWFAISQNATGHASWIAPIPLLPRLGQVFPQFLIGYGSPAGEVLGRICEVVTLVALALVAVRTDPAERRGALLAAAIVVAGVVLNLLLIAGGIDNLITRNLISFWLPAAVLVAAGLGARRAGIAGLALAAVLCGAGAAAAIGVAVDRNYQRPDWRGAVRVLGTRPAAGVAERAILIQDYRDVLPLSLYMPQLRAWHHTGTDKYSHYTRSYPVSEFDVVAIHSPPAPSTGCWWGSACNLVGSKLQSSYAIPGFHTVSVRHVYQFTIMRLEASHPVLVTPQMISGALTNSDLIYDDLLVQK